MLIFAILFQERQRWSRSCPSQTSQRGLSADCNCVLRRATHMAHPQWKRGRGGWWQVDGTARSFKSKWTIEKNKLWMMYYCEMWKCGVWWIENSWSRRIFGDFYLIPKVVRSLMDWKTAEDSLQVVRSECIISWISWNLWICYILFRGWTHFLIIAGSAFYQIW